MYFHNWIWLQISAKLKFEQHRFKPVSFTTKCVAAGLHLFSIYCPFFTNVLSTTIVVTMVIISRQETMKLAIVIVKRNNFWAPRGPFHKSFCAGMKKPAGLRSMRKK